MIERPRQQPILIGDEVGDRLQYLFDEATMPHVREGKMPPISPLLQSFINNGTISLQVAQVMYLSCEEQWTPAEIAKRAGLRRVTIRKLKRQGLNKLPEKIIRQLRS